MLQLHLNTKYIPIYKKEIQQFFFTTNLIARMILHILYLYQMKAL